MTTRRIEFEGSFNFRDLGGWQTDDGRTVRWRRLYRADSVHLLSRADVERAHAELGMRSILDLRNALEIDAYGVGLLAEGGTSRLHFPISSRTRDTVGVDASRTALRSPDEMLDVYLGMLEMSSKHFVDAVDHVAREEGLPAVFFCTAGKDRTGVLSAVILGALGVRDEDLVEDYFLTRDAIDSIIGRLASLPGSPDMYRDLPPSHFAPYEETMVRLLEAVRRTYGSFDAYLLSKGLPESSLERLMASLLSDV